MKNNYIKYICLLFILLNISCDPIEEEVFDPIELIIQTNSNGDILQIPDNSIGHCSLKESGRFTPFELEPPYPNPCTDTINFSFKNGTRPLAINVSDTIDSIRYTYGHFELAESDGLFGISLINELNKIYGDSIPDAPMGTLFNFTFTFDTYSCEKNLALLRR